MKSRQRALTSSGARRQPLRRASLEPFGLDPKRVHLLEVGACWAARPALRESSFDMGEAALELGIGAAQRGLRIHLQVAREIGDDEQKIADLAVTRLPVANRKRLLDLVRLLAQFGEHGLGVVPVEADLAGLFLKLQSAGQGGKGERRRRPSAPPGAAARQPGRRPDLGAFAFLFGLDVGPTTTLRLRVAGCRASPPKTCGWRRISFVVIASTTPPKSNSPRLLRHASVEDDLQQQVAELVAQIDDIAALDRVGDLIGLLDREGRDGGEILLEIPWAAASRACAAPP